MTASGGTQTNPANLSVGLTGAITGAANGIAALQNAYGNIAIATSGPVIGQAGRGISAEEGATGIGSILVNGSGNVTGTGNGNSGIFAEILNPADGNDVNVDQTGNISGGYDGIRATTYGNGNVTVVTGPNALISGGYDGIRAATYGNGNVTVFTGPNALISGGQQYGIIVLSYGTGNLSISTTTNDTVTSNSAGIVAQSWATSIPQVGGITTSSISVIAAGTINSGSALTATSNVSAGIIAGYVGVTSGQGAFNAAVFGNVLVNNSANINAAGGDGIRTFNFGNGNITVNDLAGTTITAPGRGVLASNYGIGSVLVSTVAGDIINSGSSGIQAGNFATAIPVSAASSVSVTAYGTINSGTYLNGTGQPPGINAGYNPGSSGISNTNVNGTIIVDNFANVSAAAGTGIGATNYGNGSVTVTDEVSTTVSGAQNGISAASRSTGSGSVTINVGAGATITAGALYGLTGIAANESNAGNISITMSTGDVINSGGTGIGAGNQATSAPATSQISITAVGTINSGFNGGGVSPAGSGRGTPPEA